MSAASARCGNRRATLRDVARGQVDILIGTHAILNRKRVRFQKLGLLIVDEEQRFGVTQKEKIKEFATGVDVLTLSATPIPRTLHMSLAGARDMSVIETPPAERLPVQSYVVESSDAMMRGAIERELSRGGQIYFIYNRVESIDRMREHLLQIVPQARIASAHGQMSEDILEQVMMDFYEGHYDILLATSIIENGIDVANANTIISTMPTALGSRSSIKCADASGARRRWRLPTSRIGAIRCSAKRRRSAAGDEGVCTSWLGL